MDTQLALACVGPSTPVSPAQATVCTALPWALARLLCSRCSSSPVAPAPRRPVLHPPMRLLAAIAGDNLQTPLSAHRKRPCLQPPALPCRRPPPVVLSDDLVREPEGMLRALCASLDLPFEPQVGAASLGLWLAWHLGIPYHCWHCDQSRVMPWQLTLLCLPACTHTPEEASWAWAKRQV